MAEHLPSCWLMGDEPGNPVTGLRICTCSLPHRMEHPMSLTTVTPWYRAPIPRRWHRCRTWQSGSTSGLGLVERCACGAIALDGGPWMSKNARRRTR